MSAKSPTVSLVVDMRQKRKSQAVLYDPQHLSARIVVDSREWFDWLEVASSFAYPVLDTSKGYIEGFMTVRKERQQRGGQYWVAYRRCKGRLRKVYLGASEELTQACLDQVAQRFLVAKQGCGPSEGENGGFLIGMEMVDECQLVEDNEADKYQERRSRAPRQNGHDDR